MFCSCLRAQEPHLENKEIFAVLANIDSVNHYSPSSGGKISIVTLNSGAAINPLEIYLIASIGNGPDAKVKIWNVGFRCLSIEKIEMQASGSEIKFSAIVESEDLESNQAKILKIKNIYAISYNSVEELSGYGGKKLVTPTVKQMK